MHRALQAPSVSDPAPLKLALGKSEAATALSISETTLETWVREGRVPVIQIGGKGARKLFSVAALQKFLAENCVRNSPVVDAAGLEETEQH